MLARVTVHESVASQFFGTGGEGESATFSSAQPEIVIDVSLSSAQLASDVFALKCRVSAQLESKFKLKLLPEQFELSAEVSSSSPLLSSALMSSFPCFARTPQNKGVVRLKMLTPTSVAEKISTHRVSESDTGETSPTTTTQPSVSEKNTEEGKTGEHTEGKKKKVKADLHAVTISPGEENKLGTVSPFLESAGPLSVSSPTMYSTSQLMQLRNVNTGRHPIAMSKKPLFVLSQFYEGEEETPRVLYFEEKLDRISPNNEITIGMVKREHEFNTQIGSTANSYGYSSTKGFIHNNVDLSVPPKLKTGDVVGEYVCASYHAPRKRRWCCWCVCERVCMGVCVMWILKSVCCLLVRYLCVQGVV